MTRWNEIVVFTALLLPELVASCTGASDAGDGGTSRGGNVATGGAISGSTVYDGGGSVVYGGSRATYGGSSAATTIASTGGAPEIATTTTLLPRNSGGALASGGSEPVTSGGSLASAGGFGGTLANMGSSETSAGGAVNSGGMKVTGGTATDAIVASGGTKSAAGASATGGVSSTGGSAASTRVSVLQHHNRASRDGVYVDSVFTKAAVASLHLDTTFAGAALSGPTYAQPLYLVSNGRGPDLVIVVTEQNRVYAFNADTGAQVYNVLLGPPLPRSQLASLSSFCGNIDPLGTTGTPVIDESTRTIYLDAMTSLDATAASARHQVYALNADTGAVVSGWPVDLNARVPTTGGTSFNSLVQNQRGALALIHDTVFVPFGGHVGDCGSYHGWVVGISAADPTKVSAWATRAVGGGIWAPGGIASDGTSLFFVTGNTEDNPNDFTPPDTWQDGEAVFRLSTSLAGTGQSADYFAPTNWAAMDAADQDLGGANPLVVDVPGATPSHLIIALGKDGKAYALDRANLGGISTPVSIATVSTGSIITAPASYATPSGSYVVFKGTGSGCPSGQSGGLTAVKIGATTPPSLKVVWCAGPAANTSVAVSMSNAQGQDAMVWIVGTDNKLHALDGDTGANVFSGGSSSDSLSSVQKFIPPIIANGRVFVAGNSQLYALMP